MDNMNNEILKPGDLVYDDDAVSHKIPEGYIGVISNNIGAFNLHSFSSDNVAIIKEEDLEEFLYCEKLTNDIWAELERRDPDEEILGLDYAEIELDLVEKYNLHDVIGYDLSEADINGLYIFYDIVGCTVEEEYEL